MRRTPTPSTSESTLASTRRKQVRIAHACKFSSRGAHFRRSDECTGEPALVHEQQSMGAHETSCCNPHWLALEVLVPHHLLEASAPGSPHLTLKSESSVPVAEADKVFCAGGSPSSRSRVKRTKTTTSAAGSPGCRLRRSPSHIVRWQWNIQHGCTLTARRV